MNTRGFTLVEVLLSVSILSIIAGMSIPVYQSFLARNDLSNSTESTASAIRRAISYARGSKDDSAWGIKVQSSSITLFKGSAYASRDASYDEPVSIPGIAASGMDEVIFSKGSGVPSTTGTITLATNNNDTRTVTVNAKGMVAY